MAEVVSCPPKSHNIKAWTHTQGHAADPLLHYTVFNAHMRCQTYWHCYIKCAQPQQKKKKKKKSVVVVDDAAAVAVVVVHEHLTVLSMQMNY